MKEKLKHYRISVDEFEKMKLLLGREPKAIEWPLFSAMWSEHCSYKSSRVHLKKFAETMNKTVVSAAGENAGVVDLGEGERIAFKMESHNHPSFIEPYQGAATGVGGILRDIFTMGARPIAIADYLCFGETSADRMPQLMDGVVRGISGYGNCVGVPTVTGQTEFHSSYNHNILVNAMAVGLFRKDDSIALSGAQGVGNFVVYVGAKTGKDGVHGAAMASESFDENSETKKPNVQIGDPYFEKLLIESCLAVIQAGLVVSIQDMGAAGLTSSSFEMASKGQLGMTLDLSSVPLRDSSMTPEEILLSESQERMLLICEPGKYKEIQNHFARWGLDAQKVGEVLKERKVKLLWKGDVLTEMDPDLLVENAPLYKRPFEIWNSPRQQKTLQAFKGPENLLTWIQVEIEKAEHADRKPIFRQYDQRVGALTAHGADSDIALLRLPDSGRGLAVAVGCRPQVMRIDARLGALDAVFYPALQMAIKGAKACAVTDCLNFGNPEKIEIMSEFVASVEAIKEASQALQAPVISGNVSFYNETMGVNITSTPATGLIGLRKDVLNLPKDRFTKAGNTVFLLHFKAAEISGSFQTKQISKQAFAGELVPTEVASFLNCLQELSLCKSVQSSQAVGAGGLALALAKMSLNGVGIESILEQANHEWLREMFYQVIFEVSDPAVFLKSWEQAANGKKFKTPIEILEIGKTLVGTFCLGQNIQQSIKPWMTSHGAGLQKFFQGVSV